MNRHAIVAAALAVALTGLTRVPLEAQLPPELRDYPLADRHKEGDIVAPFFDGWIANEDGSVTYIFGFMNRNTEEVVDIPLGPDNYISPPEFDGVQPTHFPVYDRGGLQGIRERGAFAVTVPAERSERRAQAEVVWTLTHAGHTYSIPARATSPAYEMSSGPAAFGSLNPAIRFNRDGPESTNRQGIMADRVTAIAGIPVTLSALVQDRGEREGYENDNFVPVGVEWIRHQGPGEVQFEPQMVSGRQRGGESDGEGGAAMTNNGDWSVVTTQATFMEPGNYIIRLRADNFMAPDSRFDNQCCWSNAYVPVTVRPDPAGGAGA